MRLHDGGGRKLRRVCGALAVMVVAGGTWRLARAEPARPATTPWGGNPAAVGPGEIVIRPTGRKVRVITLTTAAAAAPQGGHAVRVIPAAAVTTAVAPVSAKVAADDEALEYGAQSVRLPLAYDPRENFGYGMGPIIYDAAPHPYAYSYGYAGCGYGGYGYSSLGYSGLGYSGYGIGHGYSGYHYGGAGLGGYGHHGYGGFSPAFSSFCRRW